MGVYVQIFSGNKPKSKVVRGSIEDRELFDADGRIKCREMTGFQIIAIS